MASSTYRLEIGGEVTDLVRSELGAATLRHERGNTVLEAVVRDQSELYGLLQRVSGLGLSLVSLEMVGGATRPHPISAERTP